MCIKWAYFNRKDLVYIDLPDKTKIDFLCLAQPPITLMLFKNETNNDFVVAEYLTGVKIGSCATRKKAKETLLTEEMAVRSFEAINFSKRLGTVWPQVNKL